MYSMHTRMLPVRRSSRVAALLAAAGIAGAAHADTWVVRGRVEVRHQLGELIDKFDMADGTDDNVAESPLAGIEVEVHGRARVTGVWGTWNSWGTDVTDADGEFSISESAGTTRQIRVQVRMKSDDLVIRDAEGLLDSAKWYTIYQAERTSGTISLGDLTFRSGGTLDRNDAEAREQADFWVLGQMIMQEMDDLGYPFADKLEIEQGYHTGPSSYCNPYDNVVHIHRDHFDTGTVIHEVMHSWLFRHMTGEDNMTAQLIEGNLHCLQDSGESWVAFVEGFSHFCEEALSSRMFGGDLPAPFNRDFLRVDVATEWEGCGETLGTLDRMERHCAGWVALFRVVALGRFLVEYDFNTPTATGRARSSGEDWIDYEMPWIGFKDILDTIANNSSTGEMDRDDMNFSDFLGLVVSRNPGIYVNSSLDDNWLELLDPTSTVQPTDLFPER